MGLHEVFARVLDEPEDTFTDESTPDSVPGWTSLRHVTLLVTLENEYHVRFTNAEMATMRSYGDIRAALDRKGVTVA
jgi:acyl carrier protein